MTYSELVTLFNVAIWLLIGAALVFAVRRHRRRVVAPGVPSAGGSHHSWRLTRRRAAAPAAASAVPAGGVMRRAAARRRTAAARPAPHDPRRHLDDRGVRRLAATFAERDRLRPAEAALPELVDQLDATRWMAIWDFPVANGQAPLVLLGPSGAFVLAAGNGGFTSADAARLTTAAAGVQEHLAALTGYSDPVRCAIVWPLENGAAKQWTVPAGPSSAHTLWAVGADTWQAWLEHYSDRGFTSADLHALSSATATVAAEQYGAARPSTVPARVARG